MAVDDGCQDLLSSKEHVIGKHGVLKKKKDYSFPKKLGHLQSHSGIRSLEKHLSWNQKYVVLCEGCLYHYSRWEAEKPSGAFSLLGYNDVKPAEEMELYNIKWAFKLIYVDEKDKIKNRYFAAASEREMEAWIKSVKREMEYAAKQHRLLPSDRLPDDPLYKDKKQIDSLLRRLQPEDTSDSNSEDNEYAYPEPDEWLSDPNSSTASASALPPSAGITSTPDILKHGQHSGVCVDDSAPAVIPRGKKKEVTKPTFNPDLGVRSNSPPFKSFPKQQVRAMVPEPAPITGIPLGTHSLPHLQSEDYPPAPPAMRPPSTLGKVPSSPPQAPSAVKDMAKDLIAALNSRPQPPTRIKPQPPPHLTKLAPSHPGVRQSIGDPVMPSGLAPMPPSDKPEQQGVHQVRPPVPPKNIRITNEEMWKRMVFNGDNNIASQHVRVTQQPGTYLVRKRENDDDGTAPYSLFVCSINIDTIKYKIVNKDNNYALNSETSFDSVCDLINYYRENPLPNRELKLTMPYSHFSPSSPTPP